LFFKNLIKGEVKMVNKAKHETPGVIEVQLPHGFVGIKTVAMLLDVMRLKKSITPRMGSLRNTIGTNKAEKLAGFCTECLMYGETTIVAVVAKRESSDQKVTQFLCLCPCAEVPEVFQINGTFLRPFDSMEGVESKLASVVLSTVRNVERATL